jgi:hypothetical protein
VFGRPQARPLHQQQRYGGRDANRCGDDWVKPSVKQVIEHYGGNTWGDFSNMNGGTFAPDHKTHQTGNDVDGHFEGYNDRDAATAATILGQLNDAAYGSRITKVFVTYEQTAGNSFWNAIKDVTLTDGRAAGSVIRPLVSNGTHFHWLVSESGGGGGAASLAVGNDPPRGFAAAAASNTCWAGTITASHHYQQGTGVQQETAIYGSVVFTLGSVTELPDKTYYNFEISGGVAGWSESGNFGLCTYDRSGSGPLSGSLTVSHDEAQDKWTYSGNVVVEIEDPWACAVGPNTGVHINNWAWMCIDPLSFSFDGGASITGSCQDENHFGPLDESNSYQWQFHGGTPRPPCVPLHRSGAPAGGP